MIGGQWPQQRLFEKGYVSSPLCQACSQADGTMLHRHIECDAWQNDRAQFLDSDICIARRSGIGGRVFWDRG
eukprot:1895344-Heterocapsa_arctica.AAC.1